MAELQVLSNGNAPAGGQVGDIVHTGGGDYQITSPDTFGASYNPESGYWSKRVTYDSESRDDFNDVLDEAKSNASANSATSLAYALMQNEFQIEQNAKAMAFNSREAQKNRDWQEMMSNTAHQREVADLIAAGLNPVLSATGGQGASTGSGATASGVTSSGAKGDVDTSYNSLLGTIISQLMKNQTDKWNTLQNIGSQQLINERNLQNQIDIAKISQKTAETVAAINGAYGLQSTALAGANALNLAEVQKNNEAWLRQNYPQNESAQKTAIFKAVLEALKTNPYSGMWNNSAFDTLTKFD